MKSEPCTFCDNSAPLRFEVSDFNRGLSGVRFAYYRCLRCRLIFLSPHPTDLSKYYPKDYYGATLSLADLKGDIAAERYKIDLVHGFASSGRLLEIGPSRGAFAHLAQQGGFQVSAIERDEECCRFLSEVIGVNAINHVDPTAALPQLEAFDVIALWQVIEHLSSPWEFIRAAAEKLKPGGYLFIATPNPDSWQFRIFGRFWAHLDAPRHLQIIPATVLRKLGTELGLKEVMLNTVGDGNLDRNNLFGWQRSVTNLLGRTEINPFIRLNMARIAYRLRRLEQQSLRGTCYTLALRKDH